MAEGNNIFNVWGSSNGRISYFECEDGGSSPSPQSKLIKVKNDKRKTK